MGVTFRNIVPCIHFDSKNYKRCRWFFFTIIFQKLALLGPGHHRLGDQRGFQRPHWSLTDPESVNGPRAQRPEQKPVHQEYVLVL